MKKKKKKINYKKNFIVILFLLFILLLYGLGKTLLFNNVSYHIESRIEQLEEVRKEKKDTDVVAWVKVQGTNIDYPVITSEDAIEYQDGDLQFLWEVGDMEKLNRVNVILGHNVMNLSANPLITNKNHVRFEQLMSFTYLDFVKDNKYIQFTINGQDYLFKIFAVSFLDKGAFSTYNNANNGDEYVQNMIDIAKENSIFDFDVDVNQSDTLLSLVTCTRMFGDYDKGNFKVDARLVRKNEDTKNYEVTTNDNYKEVEKQMKGVGENENA